MSYLKEPNILNAVGAQVRKVRKRQRMSQEDVAHKAGIAVSQVGRLERGKLNSSITTLFVIALAMEIEPKELFDFEEPFVKKDKKKKKKNEK